MVGSHHWTPSGLNILAEGKCAYISINHFNLFVIVFFKLHLIFIHSLYVLIPFSQANFCIHKIELIFPEKLCSVNICVICDFFIKLFTDVVYFDNTESKLPSSEPRTLFLRFPQNYVTKILCNWFFILWKLTFFAKTKWRCRETLLGNFCELSFLQ